MFGAVGSCTVVSSLVVSSLVLIRAVLRHLLG